MLDIVLRKTSQTPASNLEPRTTMSCFGKQFLKSGIPVYSQNQTFAVAVSRTASFWGKIRHVVTKHYRIWESGTATYSNGSAERGSRHHLPSLRAITSSEITHFSTARMDSLFYQYRPRTARLTSQNFKNKVHISCQLLDTFHVGNRPYGNKLIAIHLRHQVQILRKILTAKTGVHQHVKILNFPYRSLQTRG